MARDVEQVSNLNNGQVMREKNENNIFRGFILFPETKTRVLF